VLADCPDTSEKDQTTKNPRTRQKLWEHEFYIRKGVEVRERDKGEKRKRGFSAEEEKEPSLCPEKAALLSWAEEAGNTRNDKTGPRVGAGPQDPRGVGAMTYDWWTVRNEGLCFAHSRANT
jgi:hypothetical protein